MPATKVVIVAVAITAALGLIIGGLIGHFATKSSNSDNVAKVQASSSKNDASENRQFLMDRISASRMEEMLRDMSSNTHLAGSVENNELGEKVKSIWSSYGFLTKENKYNVLLSYPGDTTNRNKAEILDRDSSVNYTCQTEEKILDPSQEGVDPIPPYNAYAKAGVVSSSKVYYVNYCRDEDFNEITQIAGVDLTGSIIICRYGKIFRGNKVAFAEDHGAVGVILYNDPYDYVDLTVTNATYAGTFPHTGFLPPSGAQRGSVMKVNGDPLTPELPSLDYVYRKRIEQVRQEKEIPNIPTQPMGYEDAKQFMLQLSAVTGSDEVPQDWRGAIIGLTYRYGGVLNNGYKIKISNHNSEQVKTITNQFGIIPGSEEPDRYILMGNHRDAWMFGATDALSGGIIMMEVGRVFGELLKTGWKPRRTIIFCSWDGEEHGIIGSIEWIEEIRKLLEKRAVVYLNLDVALFYPQLFQVKSSPLLFNVIRESTKFVNFPNRTDTTLYDGWLADDGDDGPQPKINDLGAGSDHTGFYHRMSITSADFAYAVDRSKVEINDWYPLYHTVYETFDNVKKFTDPTFSFHKSMAELFVELLRSLSDSTIIPFKVMDYATRLQKAHTDLSTQYKQLLTSRNLSKSLDDLKTAVDDFTTAADKFDKRASSVDQSNWSEVRRVNDQLSQLERAFSFELGVYGRPSIKHVVFAPSATNAYGSAAFPGIGDSLYKIKGDDDKAWEKVKQELSKAVYSVRSASIFLADSKEGFW